MFRTRLSVVHLNGEKWALTEPFVWEGTWEYFIIRSGFRTDFASIPKPIRWLLDSAGRNSEAAVLHDAAWRESKVRPNPKVDPWNADGMFRRALRETGTPALTRGLMWFGVRAAAIVSGRYGKHGPNRAIKILQIVGALALAAVTALAPTVVVVAGLLAYWLFSWLVTLLWIPFERSRGLTTRWPWPFSNRASESTAPPHELLVIVPMTDQPDGSGAPTPRALLLAAMLGPGEVGRITEDQVEELLLLP